MAKLSSVAIFKGLLSSFIQCTQCYKYHANFTKNAQSAVISPEGSIQSDATATKNAMMEAAPTFLDDSPRDEYDSLDDDYPDEMYQEPIKLDADSSSKTRKKTLNSGLLGQEEEERAPGLLLEERGDEGENVEHGRGGWGRRRLRSRSTANGWNSHGKKSTGTCDAQRLTSNVSEMQSSGWALQDVTHVLDYVTHRKFYDSHPNCLKDSFNGLANRDATSTVSKTFTGTGTATLTFGNWEDQFAENGETNVYLKKASTGETVKIASASPGTNSETVSFEFAEGDRLELKDENGWAIISMTSLKICKGTKKDTWSATLTNGWSKAAKSLKLSRSEVGKAIRLEKKQVGFCANQGNLCDCNTVFQNYPGPFAVYYGKKFKSQTAPNTKPTDPTPTHLKGLKDRAYVIRAPPRLKHGKINCTDDGFGRDPIPGYLKQCICVKLPREFCANEYNTCHCKGKVYYGQRFKFQKKEGERPENERPTNLEELKKGPHKVLDIPPGHGGRHCINDSFGGDPKPGYAKHCMCVEDEKQ